MIALNLWGLVGLAALPAIIVIHWYRRRYQPRPVTALFLYAQRTMTMASGRTRQRLIWRASLWLELAAAVALTWYFCDPHLSDRRSAEHLLIVLDSRASLQATDRGRSVAEVVRSDLKGVISAMGRDDRCTVIASGSPPRLLAGPAARVGDALAAIEQWNPVAPYHELDEALGLAINLAGDNGKILLASDRAPAVLDERIGILARGLDLATSGLVDARWYNDSSGERIVVRISAFGGEPRKRTLVLRDERKAILQSHDVALEPGKTQAITFALPANKADRLEVTLLGDDPLAFDDDAIVLKPARRVLLVRVELTGKAQQAVERALGALDDVVIDHETGSVSKAAALVFSDKKSEELPPAGTWQVLIDAGDADPVVGPFLARRGHPALADLDFTGAVWSGAHKQESTGAGDVLLAAGPNVLIEELARDRERTLLLHCNFQRSSLPSHSVWPSLIANIVDYRRSVWPGPTQPNLPIGQATTFVVPPGMNRVIVESPDGSRSSLHADANGAVVLPGLQQAGIHHLLLPKGADASETTLQADAWCDLNALALDARLADLSQAMTIARPAVSEGKAQIERSRGPLEHLLPIILAAICAGAAWFAFPREDGRT